MRRIGRRFGQALLAVVAASGCEAVSVVAVDVAALNVSPASITLSVGESEFLTAGTGDASGNPLPGRPIAWSSSHPNVASVDWEGVVTGLAEGVARIDAVSGGVTGTAMVTVVPPPNILLSASAVTFTSAFGGGPTGIVTVQVTSGLASSPALPLEVKVEYEPGGATDWVQTRLATPTAPTTLEIQAFPKDLVPGTHRADVAVTSPDLAGAPRTVRVTLVIEEPPPEIRLTPSMLEFAGSLGETSLPPRTVDILNDGGGELTGIQVAIANPSGGSVAWLETELDPDVAPARLTVRVMPAELGVGVYDAVIQVSATSAPSTQGELRVRLRVGDVPPEIELETTDLVWDVLEATPSIPPQTVQVRNRGGGSLGNLTVEVVSGQGAPDGWLGAALNSTTAPATLTLSIQEPNLDPGEYAAAVHISSPDAVNSVETLDVRLQVSPRPSTSESTVSATPTAIPADGTSEAVITVRLVDIRGDPIVVDRHDVSLQTTAGSLSPVVFEGDGSYSSILAASTIAGSANVTATVNGDPIEEGATVDFLSLGPTAIQLTGPSAVRVFAESAAFTLTLINDLGNTAAATKDETFQLSSSGGLGTFDPAASVTVPAGASSVTFTYRDSLPGTRTITASWIPGAGVDLGSDTHSIAVTLF